MLEKAVKQNPVILCLSFMVRPYQSNLNDCKKKKKTLWSCAVASSTFWQKLPHTDFWHANDGWFFDSPKVVSFIEIGWYVISTYNGSYGIHNSLITILSILCSGLDALLGTSIKYLSITSINWIAIENSWKT